MRAPVFSLCRAASCNAGPRHGGRFGFAVLTQISPGWKRTERRHIGRKGCVYWVQARWIHLHSQIALNDSRIILPLTALLGVTLQNLINVIDFGLPPQAAVDRPNFLGPYLGMDSHGSTTPQFSKDVLDRGFRDSVVRGLKKRGQDVYEGPNGWSQSGYWLGIQIDPRNRALSGGATRKLNSFVEGY